MNTTKYIVLTTFIFLLTLTVSSFNNYDNYKDKWDKVYKLSKNGQPKSAIKLVENIYTDAYS